MRTLGQSWYLSRILAISGFVDKVRLYHPDALLVPHPLKVNPFAIPCGPGSSRSENGGDPVVIWTVQARDIHPLPFSDAKSLHDSVDIRRHEVLDHPVSGFTAQSSLVRQVPVEGRG